MTSRQACQAAPFPGERPFAALRRQRGLSLHQASARLRVSAGHLRTVERGGAPLSLQLASRMAAEYGVPINALFQPLT